MQRKVREHYSPSKPRIEQRLKLVGILSSILPLQVSDEHEALPIAPRIGSKDSEEEIRRNPTKTKIKRVNGESCALARHRQDFVRG